MHPRFLLSSLIAALAVLAFSGNLARAVQEAGPSEGAKAAGDTYLHALQRAAEAYARRDFQAALDRLDVADQIQPGLPDTWSMRGAIYAEQHAFEKAEDAFLNAKKADPRSFWPRYNLAQLLFMQKKFGPAAEAFAKLTGDKENGELAQFKEIISDLLQCDADKAKPVLDAMKFPSDTAAYYFAHAAWEFAHQDEKAGRGFVEDGLKIFGTEKCFPYHHALVEVGWIKKREAASAQAPGLALPVSTPENPGKL